jgi:S1-C subfamily serine protease
VRAAAAAAACALFAACAPRAPAQDPYVALYRALHPSVVFFTMQIPSDDPKHRGRWDDAFGSGFVVASGAWGSRILTDAHVVDGARNLVATIGDGRHAPAHVVAHSNDDDDVAIVDAAIPDAPPMRLGSSSGLEPGEPIAVLGYPIPDAFEAERLGDAVSFYAGRIASIRKGAIEILVPVIPGQSGGPVVDARSGEVIGLAESRFDEERSIGFATPIEAATRFLAAHPRPGS